MRKKRRYKSSAKLLQEIADRKTTRDYVTLATIMRYFGKRSLGIALVFFALPNAIPLSFIPGVSLIFSIPLAIIAIQMIFTRSIWLPKSIGGIKVSQDKLSIAIEKALPTIKKLERLFLPRWPFMTSRFMESMIGIFILFLAFLLMLPIPFSNFFIACLIIIFGLGISERDGVVIMLGFITTIIYVAFIYIFIFTAIEAFLR